MTKLHDYADNPSQITLLLSEVLVKIFLVLSTILNIYANANSGGKIFMLFQTILAKYFYVFQKSRTKILVLTQNACQKIDNLHSCL
jgi:hypothetical protein